MIHAAGKVILEEGGVRQAGRIQGYFLQFSGLIDSESHSVVHNSRAAVLLVSADAQRRHA